MRLSIGAVFGLPLHSETAFVGAVLMVRTECGETEF